jgi:hypothetical protein
VDQPSKPPGPPDEWIQLQLAKHKANELRREKQQGLGRPIIEGKVAGYQLMAVGNNVHYGKWKTVFDFLDNYVLTKFGKDFGNDELKKPMAERIPFFQWYDTRARYVASLPKDAAGVYTGQMTGAILAYFGLAYNLYLLEHNAELQRRLLKRLKNRDQFYGAYYESLVAAFCILAGLELKLENEDDGNTTHVEFSARNPKTGKTYSVEAKSRQPNKTDLNVRNQLYAALVKEAAHERVVFIDINVPDEALNDQQKVLDGITTPIKNAEGSMTIAGKEAPPAFVIVTNHPYHYDLDGSGGRRMAVPVGFKVKDFGYGVAYPSHVAAFKAKRERADLYSMMEALGNYSIPTTFDGEIPEFAFKQAERRFVIGETYEFAPEYPGLIGTLYQGLVAGRTAHLMLKSPDGKHFRMTAELSDAEMAAYKQHPETFFGTIQEVGKNHTDPMEFFEALYNIHKDWPRESFLKNLKGAPDFDQLSQLDDEELRLTFVERMVLWVRESNEEIKRRRKPKPDNPAGMPPEVIA